jgi:hypothetical protein
MLLTISEEYSSRMIKALGFLVKETLASPGLEENLENPLERDLNLSLRTSLPPLSSLLS